MVKPGCIFCVWVFRAGVYAKFGKSGALVGVVVWIFLVD